MSETQTKPAQTAHAIADSVQRMVRQHREIWIQREMGDGSWKDWSLKESPTAAKKRVRELKHERTLTNFRIIKREITDSLLLPNAPHAAPSN